MKTTVLTLRMAVFNTKRTIKRILTGGETDTSQSRFYPLLCFFTHNFRVIYLTEERGFIKQSPGRQSTVETKQFRLNSLIWLFY